MIKTLLISILLFFPLIFGGYSNQSSENIGFLPEKSLKMSVKSDEFISYWNDNFRKDENGQIIAICDITYASYRVMYEKYTELSKEDRTIVNATPDYEEGYTIEDSIKELVRLHSNRGTQKDSDKRTLNQSTTIIIIVSVAVFGMSAICIFFVLKNNKIIQ